MSIATYCNVGSFFNIVYRCFSDLPLISQHEEFLHHLENIWWQEFHFQLQLAIGNKMTWSWQYKWLAQCSLLHNYNLKFAMLLLVLFCLFTKLTSPYETKIAANATIAMSIAIHKQNGIKIFVSSDMYWSKSLQKLRFNILCVSNEFGCFSKNSSTVNVR